MVYKNVSGSVTSGSLFLSFSSALTVENIHRCQIHVNSVNYLINTKSVILKSLCGSSSFNIYNIWFYISQEGMFLSHCFSQYCVCVAGCSSWTVTVRAAPSRCVSCWPNRTSWCRRETHSTRRYRTYAFRYTYTRSHGWLTVLLLNGFLMVSFLSLQGRLIVVSLLK